MERSRIRKETLKKERRSSVAIKNSSVKYKAENAFKNLKELELKYNFEPKEIEYLKGIFLKIAPNKVMDWEDWRKSIGAMDLPHVTYFSNQIFNCIDENHDGLVFFEDYLSFVNILTLGSIKQKAKFSFDMLDYGRKGFLTEEDINRMMEGVFELWNIMTNSRVQVMKDYVTKVFQQLDSNRDNQINLKEYEVMYDSQNCVFGWFEYLNQDEEFLKMLKEQDKKFKVFDVKLDTTKRDIDHCLGLLKEITEYSEH